MRIEITAEEMINKGFVTEAKRNELEKYLKAREDFINSFGPNNIIDLVKQTREDLERFDSSYGKIVCSLTQHSAFLKKDILLLVKLLSEDAEKRDLEAVISRFQSEIHQMPNGHSLSEFHLCLASIMEQNELVNNKLYDLKKRLEKPSEK